MLFLVAKLEVFREITRNYGNNSLISFREIHSRPLQQFKSFFHTVTQIINHSEIFVHIPQVTGDQGFELCLDQRKSSTSNGCRKLSNCAARMKYISSSEINRITTSSSSILEEISKSL